MVDTIDRQASSSFLVVGIGTSAGGLRALEEFFGNMPSDSNAAFVVVQHLSPDYKSLMSDLLKRHTDMDVQQVRDQVSLCPNTVFLIPPGQNMVLKDGCLLFAWYHANSAGHHTELSNAHDRNYDQNELMN